MADKVITKSFDTQVIDVDAESIFIMISGWRIRVYFTDSKVNPYSYIGKTVTINYEGNLNDVYTLHILPIEETIIK